MLTRVERLTAVFGQNGLSAHKNFNARFMSAHSFFPEPEALAQTVLNDMDRLCFYGVNNGFDGTLRAVLERLSAMVVSLTEVGAGDVKTLAKYDAQRVKMLDAVKDKKYAVQSDARATVREYIDTSVDAIDALTSLRTDGQSFTRVDERQIRYLEESKWKFVALSSAVNGVLDVASVDAERYASEIVKDLLDWREDFSNHMCTAASVRHLDDAVEKAEQWAGLVRTPARKQRAKSFPQYADDEITLLGQSKDTLETVEVFCERIRMEKEEIEEKRARLDAEQAELNGLKDALAKTKDREKEIVLAYKKTGDVAAANTAAADNARSQKDLKAQIHRLTANGRLDGMQVDVRAREEIVTHMWDIYDQLRDWKNDPVLLGIVSKRVDFNALVKMFSGRYDKEAVTKAIHSLTSVRVMVDELRVGRKRQLNEVNGSLQILGEMNDGLQGLENALYDADTEEIGADGHTAALDRLLEKYADSTEEEIEDELKSILSRDDK